MTRRDLSVRLLLVVSLAATVATSYADDEIVAAATGEVPAPGVARVDVLVSDVAAEELTGIDLEFDVVTSTGVTDLLVVPDDERLEPFKLPADPVAAGLLCTGPESCDIGFSIEAAGDGAATVSVTARLYRYADVFSEGATVEVVIGE